MLLGTKGYPVSYECSELIAELEQDIRECGKELILAVWLRNYPEHGAEFAVSYDFIVDEMPISKSELEPNERISIMSAESLLDILTKQNDMIEVYSIGEMI